MEAGAISRVCGANSAGRGDYAADYSVRRVGVGVGENGVGTGGLAPKNHAVGVASVARKN